MKSTESPVESLSPVLLGLPIGVMLLNLILRQADAFPAELSDEAHAWICPHAYIAFHRAELATAPLPKLLGAHVVLMAARFHVEHHLRFALT